MTTNLPDLAHLLALAEAATPGPWRAPETRDGTAHVVCDERMIYGNRDTAGLHEDAKAQLRANAAYIAAMSPDVCRALIAEWLRLREVEREHDRLKYDAVAYPELWKAENDARREAEAEVRRLRGLLEEMGEDIS